MEDDKCPFCGGAVKTGRGLPERHNVLERACATCGRFVMDEDDATMRPWNEADAFKIAAFIRRQNLLGKTPALTKDWQHVGGPPPAGTLPATFEEAVLAFPRTVADRIDHALLNLARLSPKPGADIGPAIDDYPLFFAEDPEAMWFLIGQMAAQRWLERDVSKMKLGALPLPFVQATRLTVAGWDRVGKLQRAEQAGSSRQAFVAMWFSSQTDAAYRDGIEPAVRDTGFEPRRIDLVEHIRKIDDEIIGEIRRSRFVIADFTGHRGGVYFEAGFAMGLGKPVIWTCQESDLSGAHFDTRQYNHIAWATPADLKGRLENRIRAVILQPE